MTNETFNLTLPQYAARSRGYLKIEEREKLFHLAYSVPSGGLILNIGIEYGASLWCLDAGVRDNNAHIVGMEINQSKIVNLPGRQLEFELIQGDSGQLVDEWDRPIDLLFIDGDHSYDGVMLDIGYIQLLKTDGIVMFHDCYDWEEPNKPHRLVPGVIEAVDEWFINESIMSKNNYIELPKVGTSRLFKRIISFDSEIV